MQKYKPSKSHGRLAQWWPIACRAAGVGLLVPTTIWFTLVDCPMAAMGPIMLSYVGLAFIVLGGVLLVVLGLQAHRWKSVGTALVIIALILTVFFQVAAPWSRERRKTRRMEQMKDRIPILDAIVADVEALRTETGRIPADESEFLDQISSEFYRILGCCWVIRYRKVDTHQYELRYMAMDIEYIYESKKAGCGWRSVTEEKNTMQRGQ